MASYVDRDDDGTATATVVVRRVARIEDEAESDDAVRQLTEATIQHLDEVSDQRTETIDQTAVTTIVGTAARDSGERAARHVSIAAVDGHLVSISGVGDVDFDRAVRSIRWIAF